MQCKIQATTQNWVLTTCTLKSTTAAAAAAADDDDDDDAATTKVAGIWTRTKGRNFHSLRPQLSFVLD